MLKKHDITDTDIIIKDKDADVINLNKIKVKFIKNMRIGAIMT